MSPPTSTPPTTSRPLTPDAYRWLQRISAQAAPLLADAIASPDLPPWIRQALPLENTELLGGLFLDTREGDWPALLWRIQAPGPAGRTHVDVVATWRGTATLCNWWDARRTDDTRRFPLAK